MNIGILGSGLMGAKLGTLFARAGHNVVFSYARTAAKLERVALQANRQAKGRARAGSPADAVKDADAVLLAVHWSRLNDVLQQAGTLAGKVVLTCSIPMNADDTKLVFHTATSGAEQLAKRIPRAHVVAAFQTVPSEAFFGVFAARRRRKRPSLVFCGDHAASKKVAAKLIRAVGFDPVDAGPLRIARYTEPFALLVAQLAYEGKGGPQLAYRFERFK